MSTPLRTVLVGFGGIGRGLADDGKMAKWFPIATHAQALSANSHFNWVGVVDPDPDARAYAASDWGVEACETLEDAVALAPDVLVLATPPGQRADAVAAFPALQGIMVEKPLGNDDGRALIDACNARGIPVQVNFWRRGDTTLRTLAAGDLAERIGTLQGGHALYGNGLANNGSHLIDMIRLLLGEPQWVQAIGSEKPLIGGAISNDVHIAFALGFASGACVTAHPVDFTHYREVSLDLWGTEGRLSIMQETLDIRHYERVPNRGLDNEYEIASDRGKILSSTVATALPNIYENLLAAIRDDAPLLSSGESALKSEAIIARILESSNQNGAKIDISTGAP